jgi:hypothetical protein
MYVSTVSMYRTSSRCSCLEARSDEGHTATEPTGLITCRKYSIATKGSLTPYLEWMVVVMLGA